MNEGNVSVWGGGGQHYDTGLALELTLLLNEVCPNNVCTLLHCTFGGFVKWRRTAAHFYQLFSK